MDNSREEQYKSLARPKYKTSEMSRHEAGIAIFKIKNNVSSIMQMCYELDARKGYKALGYNSFKECVMKELAGIINYDYAFKMKNAGYVHRVVCPDLVMGSIPEGTLRLLHPLKSEEDQKNVWEKATNEVGMDSLYATAPDVKWAIRSCGLATPIAETKELKKILAFTIYVFSPELTTKLDEVALELFEEFTKQSILVTGAPLTKDHFDKALKELLRTLRIFILDKYPEMADIENTDDTEMDD